jgi:hypothetical protein
VKEPDSFTSKWKTFTTRNVLRLNRIKCPPPNACARNGVAASGGPSRREVVGTTANPVSEARRTSAPHNQLPLQAGRPLIAIGEAGAEGGHGAGCTSRAHFIAIMVTMAVMDPVLVTVSVFATVTVVSNLRVMSASLLRRHITVFSMACFPRFFECFPMSPLHAGDGP